MLRKYGVQLVSVNENIEETASGKLVEGIHALMAEFYSANLALEVKKGMSQKAKQSQWPGKAPIGYLNQSSRLQGKEAKRVVLDPDRARHRNALLRRPVHPPRQRPSTVTMDVVEPTSTRSSCHALA